MTGTRRKESFDEAAEDYNRWRAGYPEEVVEDVLACAHIESSSRVLEVGCGTGQLSVPLANRGIDLVAVERGPNLAALARQNLARFPKARVQTAAFEDWPLPPELFDAVVIANAFHWLDPDVRHSKSARALRLGGYLTIGHAHHIGGGTPGFFDETQRYYMKWGAERRLVPPTTQRVRGTHHVPGVGWATGIRCGSVAPFRDSPPTQR